MKANDEGLFTPKIFDALLGVELALGAALLEVALEVEVAGMEMGIESVDSSAEDVFFAKLAVKLAPELPKRFALGVAIAVGAEEAEVAEVELIEPNKLDATGFLSSISDPNPDIDFFALLSDSCSGCLSFFKAENRGAELPLLEILPVLLLLLLKRMVVLLLLLILLPPVRGNF